MEVVERVAQILGDRSFLRTRVPTLMDLERVVRAGLPKRSLQLLAQRTVEPGGSVTAFVSNSQPDPYSSFGTPDGHHVAEEELEVDLPDALVGREPCAAWNSKPVRGWRILDGCRGVLIGSRTNQQ